MSFRQIDASQFIHRAENELNRTNPFAGRFVKQRLLQFGQRELAYKTMNSTYELNNKTPKTCSVPTLSGRTSFGKPSSSGMSMSKATEQIAQRARRRIVLKLRAIPLIIAVSTRFSHSNPSQIMERRGIACVDG